MKIKKKLQKKQILIFFVVIIILFVTLFIYAEGEGGGGGDAGAASAQNVPNQETNMNDKPYNVGSGVEATAQGSGLQIQQGQGGGTGGEGQSGNGAGEGGNGYSITNNGNSAQEFSLNWNDAEGKPQSQTWEVGAGQTFNFDTAGMDSGAGLTINQGTEGVSMVKSAGNAQVNFENGATVENMQDKTRVDYPKGDEQTTNPTLTPPSGNFDVSSVSGEGNIELNTKNGVNLENDGDVFLKNAQGDINVGQNGAFIPEGGSAGGELENGAKVSFFGSQGNTALESSSFNGQIPEGDRAAVQFKDDRISIFPGEGTSLTESSTDFANGKPGGPVISIPPSPSSGGKSEIEIIPPTASNPTEYINTYGTQNPSLISDNGNNLLAKQGSDVYLSGKINNPNDMSSSVELSQFDINGQKGGADYKVFASQDGQYAMINSETNSYNPQTGIFKTADGSTIDPRVTYNIPSSDLGDQMSSLDRGGGLSSSQEKQQLMNEVQNDQSIGKQAEQVSQDAVAQSTQQPSQTQTPQQTQENQQSQLFLPPNSNGVNYLNGFNPNKPTMYIIGNLGGCINCQDINGRLSQMSSVPYNIVNIDAIQRSDLMQKYEGYSWPSGVIVNPSTGEPKSQVINYDGLQRMFPK